MAKAKVQTAVEKGWRIQLLSPKAGWTHINERPIHKTKAKNAAKTWTENGQIRARIVQVRVTTETLAQEEV